jgi:hypothetical protein
VALVDQADAQRFAAHVGANLLQALSGGLEVEALGRALPKRDIGLTVDFDPRKARRGTGFVKDLRGARPAGNNSGPKSGNSDQQGFQSGFPKGQYRLDAAGAAGGFIIRCIRCL